MNEKIKCPFCGKEYTKMGLGTHIWRTHGEGKDWKNNNLGYLRDRSGWNKNLTKENSPSLKKVSETHKRHLEEGLFHPGFKGKSHSNKTKENWKKNPNMGGLREGSGRGIKGWYKQFYCRSTWELAWLVYNIEHGVVVKQCHESFEYLFEEEKHKYYPDFIVEDRYFEIKGYRDKKVKSKIDQFPLDKTLIMIEGKKEIKTYLEYVIKKYGKEFWKILYQPAVAQEVVATD